MNTQTKHQEVRNASRMENSLGGLASQWTWQVSAGAETKPKGGRESPPPQTQR